jgi:UDP-glucose 4-epimerase
MSRSILVTGGLGYIGSHTVVELIQAGYEPIIVDNLSNTEREVLYAIHTITGKQVPLYELDVTDSAALGAVFAAHDFSAVIHFAAFKAVGESVAHPLKYYRNNLDGLLTVLEQMDAHGVPRIIFSSSATVYGDPEILPLTEKSRLSVTNPYGATKLMAEMILRDWLKTGTEKSAGILRYFNPIGAHESGLIGEKPGGIPNNLLPFVAQVAAGVREKVSVFGDDYDTVDGTGVRDYVHVVDLSQGHVAALQYIEENAGDLTVNLGTGQGYSVLQIIAAFEKACGHPIAFEVGPRRPGDIATSFADVTLAQQLLGWSAQKDLDDMCRDAWRWQHNQAK